MSRRNRQLMRGKVLDKKDCSNEIKGNYQGIQRIKRRRLGRSLVLKFSGTQKRYYSLIRRMGIVHEQRQFARKWIHWRGL
eukprot:5756154-Ditylum_brightwellii.AAC.1